MILFLPVMLARPILLIAPRGIEMERLQLAFREGNKLLIAPRGIEMMEASKELMRKRNF